MEIDYKIVGRRVKEYRNRLNLTQEELAFGIGTSASYVSSIERAAKKPSLDKLADIGEVLGVTVNDLIYPKTFHGDNITDIKSGFLKRLSQYSEAEQSIIFDNLDAIVNIVSAK